MRTSIKTLEAICGWINEESGSPMTPYTKGKDGKIRANIGNFHLSRAYGGITMHRITDESCGISCPSGFDGHTTKKELELKMRAFYAGLIFTK